MEKKELIKKTVVENVLSRIEAVKACGGLHIPEDYSAENAIQAAGLILSSTTDKDNKPVLTTCSQESIANSLLYMVVNGLNPLKNQCYFISYAGKLECQKSYQGSITLAKRFGGVVEISSQVVYAEDDFEFHVDIESGRKKLIKHSQSLDSIDPSKIKGAYAIALLDDGSKELEVMTMAQIKVAWLMRKGKELSQAHEKFSDEMCKKTVINRLCKKYINSTNDKALLINYNPPKIEAGEKAISEPNSKVLMVDSEEITKAKPLPAKKVNKNPSPAANNRSDELKANAGF